MKSLGIGRAKGRWTNWSWQPNERDRGVMSDLLYKGKNAIGLRRRPGDIAGWPEVQRELAATALAADERRLDDATWRCSGVNSAWQVAQPGAPPAGAADLRFRQKASLLRIAGTAAFAEDLPHRWRAGGDIRCVS